MTSQGERCSACTVSNKKYTKYNRSNYCIIITGNVVGSATSEIFVAFGRNNIVGLPTLRLFITSIYTVLSDKILYPDHKYKIYHYLTK